MTREDRDLRAIAATVEAIGPPDAGARAEARRRQARLTKPEGSLGRLEELAVTLAGISGEACPDHRRAGDLRLRRRPRGRRAGGQRLPLQRHRPDGLQLRPRRGGDQRPGRPGQGPHRRRRRRRRPRLPPRPPHRARQDRAGHRGHDPGPGHVPRRRPRGRWPPGSPSPVATPPRRRGVALVGTGRWGSATPPPPAPSWPPSPGPRCGTSPGGARGSTPPPGSVRSP